MRSLATDHLADLRKSGLTDATISAEFRQAIIEAGLTPPDDVIADGKIHRFSSNGDPDDDAGWYILHGDGMPAGSFGCWRSGFTEKWCAKSPRRMTEQERAEYLRRMEETKRARKEEERQRHIEAAARAKAVWDAAKPAPEDHPYLKRKGVKPHGLRVAADGQLIVPVMIDGAIMSLLFIGAGGDKKFLPGGEVRGGSFLIGAPSETHPIGIAEGLATAASLHESTGYPVVVTFNAGNLLSVARQCRADHPSATILVCGDNDVREDGKPNTGLNAAIAAAQAINGILTIPELDGKKSDWNDVARVKGLEAVRLMIEEVLKPSSPEAPLTPGVFYQIAAPDLLDEPEPAARDWIWEDFLMAAGLAALVAKPKVGKTTMAYELAVKVAQGLHYLGRATRQGSVLILALEEHRREVKQRLRNLGAEQLDDIHVHVGPLADSPDTFHQLMQFIKEHRIVLVIVDTLNSFWSVQEENDAVDVTQAIKPLLSLAREGGAAVLLLHHARKSEGEHGDEIRGSGALFSLLDIALILKRHEVENQRKLSAVSRYPETPPELIIELREHGHEALGDPAAVGKAAKIAKVRTALTDSPTPAGEICKRAGVSRGAAYTILDHLVEEGQASRTGTGKRNDPYLYSRFVSVSPLRGGGANETNRSSASNGHQPPLPDGFVSFGGPILAPKTKRNESEVDGFISFKGGGGQTKRNDGDQRSDDMGSSPEGTITPVTPVIPATAEPEELFLKEDSAC